MEGTDFTVTPLSSFDISIVGGETEGRGTFSLVVVDDAISAEGDETVAVSGSIDALSLSADTVYVTIKDYEVRVSAFPNPFTPNGDGANDRVSFSVSGLDAPALGIYSLEGLPLWMSDVWVSDGPGNFLFFWDGHDDAGRAQPPGVYLFVIRDASEVAVSGHVTLAR